MSQFDLRYGEGVVSVDLSAAKSINVLNGNKRPAIEDLEAAFTLAVEEQSIGGVPLGMRLAAQDYITIVVSDITRFWMRQDLLCPILVDYLHEKLGIPFENMIILIAVGSHRFQTTDELKKLVSERVYRTVKTVNHDCLAPDLVSVGTTSGGNEVRVNPLVIDRKVIVISATSHHLMSGFSGGRKSILPGVSGLDTIVRNHVNSLDPVLPMSNPLIGISDINANPVHDDMAQAADMVAPSFGINIAINSEGQICRLITGDFKKAWEESCRDCQESLGVRISEKSDLVVVSCGGFPKDINLYQSCKSFLNAARAVKDGGEIVFLAACAEGGGTAAFFDWIKPLREGRLAEALRAAFTIDGYIFFAFIEAMAKREVHFLTSINPEELNGIPLHVYRDAQTLLRNIDFENKNICVMPYGGNTVPFLQP